MLRQQKSNKELLELLLQKCYRFLAVRQRTEQEIIDYLHKKMVKFKIKRPEKFVEIIIKRLKKENLVNDKKFIEWWVEQRSYFKPKGIFVLKQELLKKGVSKDLIDNFFEERSLDELELAKEALRKKEKVLKHLNREEKFKKAINFLLGRGFSYEVSKKAFEFFFEKD